MRLAGAIATTVVIALSGLGLLAADAANPPGFVAIVNPLSMVPARGAFSAVSCPASNSCVAVGEGGAGKPFVLVGDPATWSFAQAHTIDIGTSFGDGHFFIGSVACTSSPSSCVGVGGDGHGQPVVLAGDPSTWSAANAREIPLTDSEGWLNSVTCSSSSSCVAVGEALGGLPGTRPVVLAGDPATWGGPQAHVIGSEGSLGSVTCTSASSCVAVGYDTKKYKDRPIVFAGDPAAWSAADKHGIVPLDPTGARTGRFQSVTCASVSSCVAVGDYSDQPLVLAGDPSTWGDGQARELLVTAGELDSVTCTSAASCVAVGFDWGGSYVHLRPLMVTGDPSTWDSGQVRHLYLGTPRGHERVFASITCASSAACVAVGSDDRYGRTCCVDDTTPNPLVLAGDPSTWGAAQTQEIKLKGFAFGASQATMSTLACASATSCLDVGDEWGTFYSFGYNVGTYVAQGDPASWDSAGGAQLAGVSANDVFVDSACPAPTFCVAVGRGVHDPVLLAGDPATWGSAERRAIHVAGTYGRDTHFSSVSCVSTTWCVGIGDGYGRHGYFEFVIAGDPATWTGADAHEFRFETHDLPYGELTAVSCSSKTHCVAVGNAGDLYNQRPDPGQPIVLVGNPLSWGDTSARNIALGARVGAYARLLSVACTSRTYCVSVGTAFQGNKPLVIEGNPAKWGPKSEFMLPGAPASPTTVGGFSILGQAKRDLRSISCDQAGYCVAVGGDKFDAPWYIAGDPTTWRAGVLARPESDGASFAVAAFADTSCTKTACFVGGYANGGDFVASFGG